MTLVIIITVVVFTVITLVGVCSFINCRHNKPKKSEPTAVALNSKDTAELVAQCPIPCDDHTPSTDLDVLDGSEDSAMACCDEKLSVPSTKTQQSSPTPPPLTTSSKVVLSSAAKTSPTTSEWNKKGRGKQPSQRQLQNLMLESFAGSFRNNNGGINCFIIDEENQLGMVNNSATTTTLMSCPEIRIEDFFPDSNDSRNIVDTSHPNINKEICNNSNKITSGKDYQIMNETIEIEVII